MSRRSRIPPRIFKSPTFIRFTRPLYFIPLLGVIAGLVLIGSPHLLSRNSDEQQAPLLVSKAAASADTTIGSHQALQNNALGSPTPSPADSPVSKPSSQSESNKTAAPQSAPEAPAPAADCSTLVPSLTATLNNTVKAADTVLDHSLTLMGLSLGGINDSITTYNKTVTEAYNSAASSAKNANCPFTAHAPELKKTKSHL